jgi:hypothetical protein
MPVLKHGFCITKNAVILARNSFSEKRIIRVHVSDLFSNGNGPIPPGYRNARIAYPHQTLNEADVVSLAKAMGFKLVSRVKHDSGVYPYLGKVYGFDLTFARVP